MDLLRIIAYNIKKLHLPYVLHNDIHVYDIVPYTNTSLFSKHKSGSLMTLESRSKKYVEDYLKEEHISHVFVEDITELANKNNMCFSLVQKESVYGFGVREVQKIYFPATADDLRRNMISHSVNNSK